MIVVAPDHEREFGIEEFFELFKTPWRYWRQGCEALGLGDVLVATGSFPEGTAPARGILLGSRSSCLDEEMGVQGRHVDGARKVLWGTWELPVYTGLLTFASAPSVLCVEGQSGDPVAYTIQRAGFKIIRLGYDLFKEVELLLCCGQSIQFAHIPTLEIHIAVLRALLLHLGMPVLEIPPRPHKLDFVTCLTHDVDFMGIKEHGLDRSVIGFALRALTMRWVKGMDERVSVARLLKNWKALLALPWVHLGICKDFWIDIPKYSILEKGKASTYFFLPFKNYPGQSSNGESPQRKRAAKYDLDCYSDLLQTLLRSGNEIGLHGIDAWASQDRGKLEIERIKRHTGEVPIGVRMHWLYFGERTPACLEEASFLYDSSRGYNEAVGFACGTTQVFRLCGTRALYELPLNVMDTALFCKGRMGLSEPEAMKCVEQVLQACRRHGGVFTLNWHTRSLSPERNWDQFYVSLLRKIEKYRTAFLTARDAVGWFSARRCIKSTMVSHEERSVVVKMEGHWPGSLLPPSIRLFLPQEGMSIDRLANHGPSAEAAWSGEKELRLIG
jgi:hypothetical protein